MIDAIILPESASNGDEDDDGFSTTEIKWRTEQIPCMKKDATRSDTSLAMTSGYTADCVVEVLNVNYSNEELVKMASDGDIYRVKRAYRKGIKVQLTLERQGRKGVL